MQHDKYPGLEKREFEAFSSLHSSFLNDDLDAFNRKCAENMPYLFAAISRLAGRKDPEAANPTSHPLSYEEQAAHLHGQSSFKDLAPLVVPAHYNDTAITPLQVIDAWGLGFRLGNTVKYLARHQKKGSPLADLEKAAEYLRLEIERLRTKQS